MEIKRIIWEVSKPSNFPCAVCQEKEAEFKAKFQYKGVVMKFCLCPECVKLPETILIERIFGGKNDTE